MNGDFESIAEYHDAINAILDLVDAYRNALLARGYSPTAAEQMAMDVHAYLWLQAAARAATS